MSAQSQQPSRIDVWAARGGQGATTVAGALASFLHAPVRGPDLEALQWIWGGLPEPSRSHWLVLDRGSLGGEGGQGIDIVVVRGPCTLALKALTGWQACPDHIILLREPWRSLRTRDIEDCLGRSIDVEIPFSPRVARLADAGLLPGRIHVLSEFYALKEWSLEVFATSTPREVRGPPMQSVPESVSLTAVESNRHG